MNNDGINTLNEPAPIKGDQWYDMSIVALQDQRQILSSRLDMLSTMISGGNAPISIVGLSNALINGMSQIDGIISHKQLKNKNNDRTQ